jgi:aminoglycoside phosphotransferase family enzyme/predicted kinase
MGGEGEVLEYAVKMRRFDQDGLLTERPLDGDLPERVADRVAAFHRSIPAVEAGQPYGTPAAVLGPMRENFAQIRPRLSERRALKRLDPLEDWTRSRHSALEPLLARRREEGFVRECHGDMHRGNIALDHGQILIFDGIEFNPSLRWIDTMSEMAFLVMDLEEAGELPQARRLLNRYLELTGDYAGLRVLDLYKVYRAMVRAKVIAIRLGQPDLGAREAERDRRELEGYLDLAEGYIRSRPPCLLLTCGLSGSGKTRLCMDLRARLPVIHIRSDIERKRLFGLPEHARTGPAGEGEGLYSADASRRTYARLRELAAAVLEAGYSPLVDATFLQRSQRERFSGLAEELGVAHRILHPRAPEAVLRARVAARAEKGRDPSEADISVLEHQLATRDPLTSEELRDVLAVDSTDPAAVPELIRRLARDVGETTPE